jgi:AbrB family looped-hinge helix DNA binding protein
MSSSLVRVDERGRIVIPSQIKKRLKIGSTVRLEEKGGRLEVIPVSDPLKNLKGSAKARVNAKQLDELAESMLIKKALK